MRTSTPGYPVLSFFTGAGFLDLGFMGQGFRVVWHNEYNERFVKIFNHAMSNMGYGDMQIPTPCSIEDVDAHEIVMQAFRGTKPEVFGIIGGPPCPDFSVGGKNRGQHGDNGRLSRVYVDRICQLQPTFFLFENVPGLLKTKKHRAFLAELRQQLRKFYVTDLGILNALEYGVPQDRQRVFMVGFHKEWFRQHYGAGRLAELQPGPSQDELTWFPWPKPRFADPKLLDWPTTSPRGVEPRMPRDCPKELMVWPLIAGLRSRGLPNSDEYFRPKSPRFREVLEGDVSRKSFKRLHRWRYSPTAAYGNNEVHLHPVEDRRLSVREALIIQSVPDEYQLPTDLPLSCKFKTIANGVPVKLAAEVAASFLLVLNGGLVCRAHASTN